MRLRSLIVVTGAVRVEGGDVHTVTTKRKDYLLDNVKGVSQTKVTQHRMLSADRKAGNVISTTFMRKLRNLRIIKTPFGTLIDARRLSEVKALIERAAEEAARFNAAGAKTCKVYNCLLWEVLDGNRLAAVQGWVLKGVAIQDPKVLGKINDLAAV